LETLLNKQQEAKRLYLTKGERGLFDEADRQLHEFIVRKVKNRYLIKTFSELFDLINLLRHSHERILGSIEEHEELIKAILAKQQEKAEKILIDHLNKVEEGSIQALTLMNKACRQTKTSKINLIESL
ncbi:FCD domain-containing protein, partial [Candidatus Aerophobetes bacterium]|nr:FCD domain-containing protein [Candidatus Aerophobetes bacterium]